MSSSTVESLLRAAISVFARASYREATIAEIVAAADANISAVNYHFDTKINLFLKSLTRAFEIADDVYPIRGTAEGNRSVDERIETFSRALLSRSFEDGPAGDFNRIMSMNIRATGSPVASILTEVRKFELDYLDELIRERLPDAPRPVRAQAAANVIHSSVIFTMNPLIVRTIHQKKPSVQRIGELIDRQAQVVMSSLTSLSTSLPHPTS